MAEKFIPNESPAETPQPNELDLVKINGRWAQVISAGQRVKYLDDLKTEVIDWNDYKVLRSFNLPIWGIELLYGEKLTGEEMQNVRWGPEETAQPELKKNVRVFGALVKKTDLKK